jgi:hypothetical protein
MTIHTSSTPNTAGRDVGLYELLDCAGPFDSSVFSCAQEVSSCHHTTAIANRMIGCMRLTAGLRREDGNSVNGTSGNDRDSVSVSAIGVANRREMVDMTDWEREGCE